jgi:hypothetical protein
MKSILVTWKEDKHKRVLQRIIFTNEMNHLLGGLCRFAVDFKDHNSDG